MRRVIAAVITAAVVAAGVVAVRRGAVPEPGGVRWPLAIAAAGLAVIANNVICGLRWRLFLTDGRSRWDAVRTYSEAAFVSTFVPFGSEAYRSWGNRHALDAVVTDRILSGLAIAGAAAAGAVAVPWSPPISAAVLLGAAAVWFVLRRRLVADRVAVTLRRLVGAMMMSVLYILVSAVVFLLLFHGAGVPIGVADALAVTPAVLLGAAVPSISGVGPGLVVLSVFASSRGADPSRTATIIALLLGAQLLLGALGGALLVGRRVAERPS